MIQREIEFEAASHSVDAIQRAAYRLSDRLSCDVVTDGPTYRCTLHLSQDAESDVETMLSEFRNEVLDETLRERIRAETTEVRNLILALAFSETGLVEHADG